MKPIEKILKKIHLVDVAIILLVLAAIIGVAVRFGGGGDSRSAAADAKFNATILIHDVRESNVKALEKSMNLPFVTDEKTSVAYGTLVNMEVTPANGIVEKTDGTVVNATIPEKYDVLLTFSFRGKVNENGYYNQDVMEIAAGSTHTIRSKWCSVYGIVQRVWDAE